MDAALEMRFWSKVEIRGPNQCWPWKGGMNGSYGCFKVSYESQQAHRVAFEIFHDKKPTNWVLHKCDNKLCVNPLHLYEGTGKDNARDRAIRGRSHTIELRQKLWKCYRGGRGYYAEVREAYRKLKSIMEGGEQTRLEGS